MRFFSTNAAEPALFSVAQEAVGILALGQSAVGVVAIGQLARGVFVVGQGALGIVGIGQGVACVGWGGGMIGVAGRGFGFVARIFPKLRRDGGRPSGLAPEITMHQIWSAPVGTRGTIFGSLRKGALHDESGAAVAALEPLPQALETIRSAPDGQLAMVVEVVEREMETDDLGYRTGPAMRRALVVVEAVPWAPWSWPFEAIRGTGPASFGELALRGLGMVALVIVWWFVAGRAVVDAFLGALG